MKHFANSVHVLSFYANQANAKQAVWIRQANWRNKCCPEANDAYVLLFMVALWNRAWRPLYFHPVVSSIFLLLSFFPRLISAVADWMSTILPHMVWPCGPSVNLECRSEMWCARLAGNAGPKKSPKNCHLVLYILLSITLYLPAFQWNAVSTWLCLTVYELIFSSWQGTKHVESCIMMRTITTIIHRVTAK